MIIMGIDVEAEGIYQLESVLWVKELSCTDPPTSDKW